MNRVKKAGREKKAWGKGLGGTVFNAKSSWGCEGALEASPGATDEREGRTEWDDPKKKLTRAKKRETRRRFVGGENRITEKGGGVPDDFNGRNRQATLEKGGHERGLRWRKKNRDFWTMTHRWTPAG